MDKRAARDALKGHGFYEERHGMLLVRDNDLLSCYKEMLAARKAPASPSESYAQATLSPH